MELLLAMKKVKFVVAESGFLMVVEMVGVKVAYLAVVTEIC